LKRIHITKRDLFYTDVKLFVDQSESDGVLDDVATMIGCTRSNLHVVASDKGLVVGRISFFEDGDFIDCTKMGVGGKAIPPYIDKIENIQSDAEFILLVEKEAAYMRMAVSVGSCSLSRIVFMSRLLPRILIVSSFIPLRNRIQEDRFYQRYPCIVITAKGTAALKDWIGFVVFFHFLSSQMNAPHSLFSRSTGCGDAYVSLSYHVRVADTCVGIGGLGSVRPKNTICLHVR
jgi:DNA topoisomerase VI subunit A